MQVQRDRVRMRYVLPLKEDAHWELVALGKGDDPDKILAKFYTGSKGDPGHLAQWAFESVVTAEKA